MVLMRSVDAAPVKGGYSLLHITSWLLAYSLKCELRWLVIEPVNQLIAHVLIISVTFQAKSPSYRIMSSYLFYG